MAAPPQTGEQALRAADLAAALREATERLTPLFERSLAGAFRSTPSGLLREVNSAFARILGYEAPEDVQGKNAQELFVDPEDFRTLRAHLESERESLCELRLLRRDRSPVWAMVRVEQRRGLEGEDVIEGTMLDLTSLKEGEAGLVQAGRLAAVGVLAAGVAHEVNSPLAGVLANLAFALEALPGVRASDEEAVREVTSALEDARAAAERVRDIVRDLRLFARAEEGDRASLDVAAVLEATLGLVENQLRHRARVIRDIGQAPKVIATASSLGQAFLNLLLDAAQAIPENEASKHEVRVSLRTTPGGAALVEISDNGAEMTPEMLARAFDPYRSRRPGGPAGMGLPVARAVIESLGGVITVESEPGRGTTARVELPSAPRPPSACHAAQTSPRMRRRVLVVDDEPVVGKSLRRLLPEHEVTIASSAAEALSAIAIQPDLDVILCDLMMPEVSGIELYRELTSRYPGLAPRVVFITGGAFTAEATAFLRQAGNPLLEKPFDLPRLRALVSGLPQPGG